MTEIRDEFLSEEDLDLRNLSQEELIAYWNLWLHQAQATNDLDEALYSHGVFERDPTAGGLHRETAAWAAEHAGTDLDLDRDLEHAGLEALDDEPQ